ncbi:MAG TPA: GH3 auxin-responsive promoter family protein [Thiobacillus sp.]|nr:GH3 auxin-responsive promoter family protein [Thiobacillus sp.]
MVAYPASFLLAITAFLWASTNGYPKWVSAYLPVIVCAAVVLPVLERISPHRRDWRPDSREWFTDALYTIVIQIAMPPLLALLVVLGLSDLTRPYLHSSLWPHHWPLLAQGILMVLLVDLMRYWVHRFAHTNPTLWRLHAVHHSPDKLYWLNTARFHPLEKVLQFCFDSMPFILLGVNEYVLAFYFVCYAVNGFYQHSNVHLRLGLLNYIFSTAELHRWHHSKILEEANHNYSNTTIVWDMVFGTYYRPRDRRMERAGIQNDRYPMRFGQQLIGPFVRNLEIRDVFVPSLCQVARNLMLRFGFAIVNRTAWRELEKSSHDVAAAQKRVLHGILQQNRNTAFGQRHRFAEVNSIADYQRLCPVQGYDSLRPYIDEQESSGKPAITAEAAEFYAQTSGTTGAAKRLPVTPTMLKQIKRQQALAGFLQYRACPQAFGGALLGITGAAEEDQTATGKTVGAISGVMYEMLPWPMKRKFILPSGVFGIKDHLTKYLLILRLALAERDITYIATANPSTFVLLLELAHTHREELLTGIETGQWPAEHPLPINVANAMKRKLRPNRARSVELRALFASRNRLMISDIWPHVALMATWTGGNCRIPLQAIKAQLPERAVTMDLGLLASECRITLTVEANTRSGMPVFTDYFFEFVERAQWDNKQPEFLTLDQLEQGNEYYLFVTTTGGLYRYDMNDIVKVAGFRNSVPLIEFLQKGRGVTNITGEKLYEKQLIQATADLAAQCSLDIPFFIVLADRIAGHYEFYFELSGSTTPNLQELGRLLDRFLCQQNDEYKQKLASGRLKPLQARQLKPGTATHFRTYMVERGQKDGQFKVQCLAYKDEVDFDFSSQLATESLT